MKYILSVILAAVTVIGNARDLSIIPVPSSVEIHEGCFMLKHLDVSVEPVPADNGLADPCGALMEMIGLKICPSTGFEPRLVKPARADLRFVADNVLAKDAYSLVVDKKGVTVRASGYGGYFYGLQTLLQILPPEIKSGSHVTGAAWEIPCVRMEDSPRFGWRGMMLDVSRHWFTKEEVMKYIDEIAEYKFNVFHWHLTDDQGWRIKIDSCPELTERGAMRATRIGGDWWKIDAADKDEPLDYGGYYTRDDVREVVEFAAKRNVAVMPEVDVPGHSTAMLVAYPELACFKAPESVNVGNAFYGVDENALCPGNERTFEILAKVFGELAEMFPFDYIHIGGDECYRGFWSECPKCIERRKQEGIADNKGLQSYFVKRVEKILLQLGKKVIGWDEIMEGGLAESATVMSWRGMQGGTEAAQAGHHVVMTPQTHCYLDLYQGEKTAEPTTYSSLRLDKCYSFEPVPEGVDPSLILGGQGNLWTEFVPHLRHAEYMSWPRGWALSEVFWSSKGNRSWEDFIRRMEDHFRRADCGGVNFPRNSAYNAIVTVTRDADGKLLVTLDKQMDDIELRYTFDNTNPDEFSDLYAGPLSIPRCATNLKVQSFRNGRMVGDRLLLPVEALAKRVK